MCRAKVTDGVKYTSRTKDKKHIYILYVLFCTYFGYRTSLKLNDLFLPHEVDIAKVAFKHPADTETLEFIWSIWPILTINSLNSHYFKLCFFVAIKA